ncbi:hypothetical protein niasHS_013289 [Heterodera schachtii]|uniref:PH domain-containing protein n=1 Tax=Heterodera schachtii TaxID=97005 RepID=A0ABD2IHH4_HETSC
MSINCQSLNNIEVSDDEDDVQPNNKRRPESVRNKIHEIEKRLNDSKLEEKDRFKSPITNSLNSSVAKMTPIRVIAMDDVQEILNRKDKRDAEFNKIIAAIKSPALEQRTTPGFKVTSAAKNPNREQRTSPIPITPTSTKNQGMKRSAGCNETIAAESRFRKQYAPPPPPITEKSTYISTENDKVFRPITPTDQIIGSLLDDVESRSRKQYAPPPPPITETSTSISAKNDNVFRPVTPTDQIIGSLWDDINSEMEKYKQSKQYQSDPNLSPRTHFGSCSLQEGHSISSYRSQSVKRMGQSETGKVGAFSSSHDSLSMLPEKRQRADLSLERGVISKQTDTKNDHFDGSANQQMAQRSMEREAILKRLHEAVVVQQDQICQASRALAFCRQNERFLGSREEIDAQRALLISTERRKALLIERENVINGRYLATENDLKGTLTFSAIAIRLSREYIAKFTQNHSNTSLYYFIVLIRCGEHVFHTTLSSSDQGIRSGFIEFSHLISVSGLSPDFSCDFEVYSLKAGHDSNGTERNARGKKGTWRKMVISTPMNYTNSLSAYSSSAHRPIGVMDTGFQRVGHLTITRHMVQQNLAQQQKHLLSHLTYPLEGTVVLTLDCHPDENSLPLREYRSFLSRYELVSGLSSWSRFWCSLGGGHLRFWRYPEDEATKVPCVQLDLARCVSQVVAVPSSAASFPNSMQVEFLRIDEKTHQRDGVSLMLFAADTPEEKEHWMDCINQSIRRSNVWRAFKRKC